MRDSNRALNSTPPAGVTEIHRRDAGSGHRSAIKSPHDEQHVEQRSRFYVEGWAGSLPVEFCVQLGAARRGEADSVKKVAW